MIERRTRDSHSRTITRACVRPHKPQAVEPQRQPFGGGGAEYWPARPAPTRAECKLYEGFIKHCSGPDHKPSTVRWWHLNDDIIRP